MEMRSVATVIFALLLVFANHFLYASSEKLLDFLLDNPDLPANLHIARKIAQLERPLLRAMVGLIPPGYTILIPTDTAWDEHPEWLQVVLTDSAARRRVARTGITSKGPPLVLEDARVVSTLKGFANMYAVFPQEGEDGSSRQMLCLIQSRQPTLVFGKCTFSVGPVAFEDTTVYFVESFILRDEIVYELELKAAAFANATTAFPKQTQPAP